MVDSLSIQPVVLSGLAGIPPVAFQRLATTAAVSTASVASLFSGSSNGVELSANGLLLSAVSSFRFELATVQTRLSASNPTAIADAATSLVEAFNNLQANTIRLQSTATALSDTTLASQFSRTLNDLVSRSIAIDSTDLTTLQGIGIDLLSTPTSTGSALSLSLDSAELATAISANPERTRAVLVGATQSLIDLATEFETQLASATVSLGKLTPLGGTAASQIDLGTLLGLPTDSTTQGIGVPTDLLQNLNADTVLNAIGLPDLDLDALGLDAATLSLEDSLLRGALANALLTPNNTAATVENLLATLNLNLDEQPAGTATVSTPATTSATAAPGPEPPVTTAQVPPIVSSATTGIEAFIMNTNIAAANDALLAERQASEATLALQSLLANPALRARNNLFDPAYAAMIAATHLSDFVSPDPTNDPAALAADAVQSVMPIAASRAIGYYNEAATEVSSQFARRAEMPR